MFVQSKLFILVIAATMAATCSALLPKTPPLILFNGSESVPVGFYGREVSKPELGQFIAFRIPEPGRPYAARHLPVRLKTSILKPIVARTGATVCAREGVLSLNGVRVAPIATHDRGGEPLPHWSGCRRLGPDESFVLSTRIPNSFDSRYYDPVRAGDLLGVYRPLWTVSEAPEGPPRT